MVQPVPTLNLGPTANFKAVPKVQPVGMEQVATEFARAGENIKQLANQSLEIHRQEVKVEAQRKGLADGAREGFDPSTLPDEVTTAALAYRQAASQSYLAQMGTARDEKFFQLERQHANNPELMREQMAAYVESTTADMPDDVAASYTQLANQQALDIYQRSYVQLQQRQQEQMRKTIQSRMDLLEYQIQNTTPQELDENGKQLFTTQQVELARHVEQAVQNGVITPAEGQLRIQRAQDSIQQSTINAAILNAENPIAAAVLDPQMQKLPPQQRLKALSYAVQQQSALENMQNRQDKALEKARDQFKASLLNTLYQTKEDGSPLVEPGSPEREQIIDAYRSVSTDSTKDFQEFLQLQEEEEDLSDARFNESDPAMLSAVQTAIASPDPIFLHPHTGKPVRLTENYLMMPGNGLSTKERLQALEDFRKRPESVYKDTRFKTFMLGLEEIYPTGRQLTINANGEIDFAASFFASKLDNPNKQKIDSILLDVRRKIDAQDINIGNMQDKFDVILNTHRQQKNASGAIDPSTPIPPDQVKILVDKYDDEQAFIGAVTAGEIFVKGMSDGEPTPGMEVLTIDQFNQIQNGYR